MAQKKSNVRERQIGKKPPVKKTLIDPRYKNTFWTIVVLVILIIFFIVNNTRSVPDNGPLPPGYNPENLQERLESKVPEKLNIVDTTINKKE